MKGKEDDKKKSKSYYVLHVAIGLTITFIFWVIPPLDPITPLGMRCLGSFLGMVYMWTAIGPLWPSLFGLFMLGISGFAGDGVAGFNAVWLNAVGVNTVLLVLFAFVLFGALDEVGDTKYIARWLLTRKVYKGRPYVFMAIFYLTCFVLSALVQPIVSLIMLWPVALRITKMLDIKRGDRLWKFFFVGMFLVSTLAQPFFPFLGAQLIPISAFANMTQASGTAMTIPMVPYMALDVIMTVLIMAIYLLIMKLTRVDVSKMKSIDPSMIEEEMALPPMNVQQKAYLWMVPVYLLMILLPNFIKDNPVSDFLNTLGTLGVTVLFVIIFLAIKWHGKPLLNYQEVAYKQMNWGIFFMIAAAVYAANTLSDSSTGVTDWLVQVLNPILGNQPEMVFVAILFTVALVITNFANNAAMAVVLTPVVIAFSNQLGINPVPVEMGVILMVFVAMLTPAASPHAGMMWGRKDIYSPKDIMSIGFPMCLITLVSYICIGYPLAKLLIGA